MRISDWSSDVCSSDRGRPSTSSATAAGPSLFPPPGEHRRDGVVPDDTHHRPREAAQPPAVVQIIDHLADSDVADRTHKRSEEHTSELQSLMRISYAVFCLQKKKTSNQHIQINTTRI